MSFDEEMSRFLVLCRLGHRLYISAPAWHIDWHISYSEICGSNHVIIDGGWLSYTNVAVGGGGGGDNNTSWVFYNTLLTNTPTSQWPMLPGLCYSLIRAYSHLWLQQIIIEHWTTTHLIQEIITPSSQIREHVCFLLKLKTNYPKNITGLAHATERAGKPP